MRLMENENDKRKRSPNWLPSEKQLLLELVEEHFSVIENKKTDGVTSKKKLAEWNKMQEEYNSRTVNCSRSANNLKAQWESLKKAARKEAAENKSYLMRTGGGPPKTNKDDVFLRIISLIKTTAVGLNNHFDSDYVEASGSQDSTAPDTTAQVTTAQDTTIVVENMDLIQTEDNSLDDIIPEDGLRIEIPEKEDVADKDWGDYTPRLLQMPVSTPLRVQANNTGGAETMKRKSWVSRRLPNLGVTATSSLEKLHLKKIEALEVQTKLAYEEREDIKELNAIEAELKKEKLKQEKIATRILLLDLRLKKQQLKIKTLK